MAKAKKQDNGVNKSKWFRDYFTANKDQLKNPSKDTVKAAWATENPGVPWNRSVEMSMANAKTAIRKKFGIKSRRRRKGTGRAGAAAPAAARRAVPAPALRELEGRLDECIMTALKHDNENLKPVLQHLRKARLGVFEEMLRSGGKSLAE